jgi:solute carrier family 35 protein E1
MTSHTPPRLSSNPPHQSWRQFDEKSTYLSSLSSTLKTGRSWLASSPPGTLSTHHHEKNHRVLVEWRGSSDHHGFFTQVRKATRKLFRSPSDSLPNFTLTSRRASGLGTPQPPFDSNSSSHLSAFPPWSTVRFVLLCGLWYASSALSSNTGKAILNQFRYPVSLTFVQFGFVAAYCLLFMSPVIRFTRLRRPTRAILKDTLPMGCFQVGGHIFSSMAISRIPVSTTHTIKVRAQSTCDGPC